MLASISTKKEIWWWGIVFLVVAIRYVGADNYKNLNGQKVRITGKITTVPIRYSNSQRVEIAGLKTYLPLFPEVSYGDKIVVEGTVGGKNLKTPVLKEFVDEKSFLADFRERIISFYQKNLPEPHASLVAGVTLGAKSNLPADFWESLKKTGVAHVVVASGMNVTFVLGFLVYFLAVFLPRKKAIPLAILGVLGYLALSGFDPPLIRAAIMGTVAFAAQETGRLVSAWRALAYSAMMMIIVRPDWIGDLGFILSFFATASLVAFKEKIDKKLLKIPKIIREDFSTTLAAQIGVTPILFVTFGQFNILSPMINVLVLWTVAPMMIIGAVAGVAGLLIPVLGKLVLYLAYPLTWWFVAVVEIFG